MWPMRFFTAFISLFFDSFRQDEISGFGDMISRKFQDSQQGVRYRLVREPAAFDVTEGSSTGPRTWRSTTMKPLLSSEYHYYGDLGDGLIERLEWFNAHNHVDVIGANQILSCIDLETVAVLGRSCRVTIDFRMERWR